MPTDMAFIESPGSPGTLTFAPSGFGNGGTWALSGDSVLAIVDGYIGTVEWLRMTPHGAETMQTNHLAGRSAVVTAQDVAQQEERIAMSSSAGGGGRSATITRATILNPPAHWSIATQSFFSCDGALWVGAPHITTALATRTTTIENNQWTVFTSGTAPFSVDLPSSFRLRSVCGAYLVGDNSSEGVTQVHVYRLGRYLEGQSH
jgi:hypothetical protein